MTARIPMRIAALVAVVVVTIASLAAVALGLHLEPNVAGVCCITPEVG